MFFPGNYSVVSQPLHGGAIAFYVAVNGRIPSSPVRYKSEAGAARAAERLQSESNDRCARRNAVLAEGGRPLF